MDADDLPKSLRKYAHRIASVSDERGSGDGYWVYLVEGWVDPMTETHCVHEDTITECARNLRHIEPCDSPACCPNPAR